MENNRIALYTRLLQFQYEAARHAGDADKLADAISAQRREIEALEAELKTSKARHAAEVQALQRGNPRLKQLPSSQLPSLASGPWSKTWATSLLRNFGRRDPDNGVE
jgi:septal ring factor EnvC (AmiA/AmiB activator)